MAPSKKILTWIFIAVAVIIIALAIWYFTRSKVADPNKSNTPVPPGSPTPKWIAETFPLNIGMYGTKIKALQAALGITADGKFGPQTNSAIMAAQYTVPLSQADYNLILNPLSANIGKIAYANKDGVTVYNADYSVYKTAKKDEWIGTVTGTGNNNYFIKGGYIVPIANVYLQ